MSVTDNLRHIVTLRVIITYLRGDSSAMGLGFGRKKARARRAVVFVTVAVMNLIYGWRGFA